VIERDEISAVRFTVRLIRRRGVARIEGCEKVTGNSASLGARRRLTIVAEGISDMDCLSNAQVGRYEPTDRGFESIVKERLTSLRAGTSPSGTSRREAEE
jgi:hypothetical protein